MKISDILNKEFDNLPSLSAFVDFTNKEKIQSILLEIAITQLDNKSFIENFFKISFDTICGYNNLLKQPIELKRLVPCDEDGSVLEEPKEELSCNMDFGKSYKEDLEEYKKALEQVWFKGFKISHKHMNNYLYVTNGKSQIRIYDDSNLNKTKLRFLIDQPITKHLFKQLDS